MENRIERLTNLAHLAKSAPLHDREQIERIILMTEEAAATTRRTVKVMNRIMNKSA